MKTVTVESMHRLQVRRIPGCAWRIPVVALNAVRRECMWVKKKKKFAVSC